MGLWLARYLENAKSCRIETLLTSSSEARKAPFGKYPHYGTIPSTVDWPHPSQRTTFFSMYCFDIHPAYTWQGNRWETLCATSNPVVFARTDLVARVHLCHPVVLAI
jgi:hypothetical protein